MKKLILGPLKSQKVKYWKNMIYIIYSSRATTYNTYTYTFKIGIDIHHTHSTTHYASASSTALQGPSPTAVYLVGGARRGAPRSGTRSWLSISYTIYGIILIVKSIEI